MEGDSRLEEQPLHQRDVRSWQGELVFDEAGEVIGKVSDVLVDASMKPEWMIVTFGAFLHNDRLIPVFDMKMMENGLVVSYSKEMMHKAPVVRVEGMSDADEQKLSAYWCTTREAAMPRTCSLLSARH
jgi:uncharacterized protein YrrD